MGLLETLADALTRNAGPKAEYGTPSPELTQQMRSGGLTGGLLRAANPMVWDDSSAFAQWTRKPAGSPMGAAALDEILNGPVMGTFGGIGRKGVPGYVEDAATREANFKKWGRGLPEVPAGDAVTTGPGVYDVFHGTGYGFESFKPSRMGEFGPGTYLTTSPTEAGGYAKLNGYPDGTHARIVPAKVRLDNPFVVDGGPSSFWEKFASASDEEAIHKAKAAGHDGVIYVRPVEVWDERLKRPMPTGEMQKHIVVFPGNETQIKSIFNRGTYDPTDPNILKSLIPAAATAYGIEEVLPYD